MKLHHLVPSIGLVAIVAAGCRPRPAEDTAERQSQPARTAPEARAPLPPPPPEARPAVQCAEESMRKQKLWRDDLQATAEKLSYGWKVRFVERDLPRLARGGGFSIDVMDGPCRQMRIIVEQ
jgi:hypothetical protein